MPTMREEMDRDLNDWLRIQAGDHIEEPEAFLIWLRSRGWTRQEPYDSITDPNHPAIAVTPAVALLENALELLRPHTYMKGGDASADRPIHESAKHSTNVTADEGDVATDDAMTLQQPPTVQPGQESESEASAPSPESALRYSLGEPDPGACEYCGGTGKKCILSGRATPDCKYCNGTGNAPRDSAWNAKKRQPDVQTACSPEAIDEVLEADFPEVASPNLDGICNGTDDMAGRGLGTDRLCEVLYGQIRPEYWLGGGDAKMLRDAVDTILALRSQIKQIREVLEIEGSTEKSCSEWEEGYRDCVNYLHDEIDRITGQK